MKTLRHLTNMLPVFAMAGALLFSSCKKDDKDNGPKLTEDQINACAEAATTISTELYSAVTTLQAEALQEGFEGGDIPDINSVKKSGPLMTNYSGDYSWTGPDGQGWYTRHYTYGYGYDYSEKLRITNDTVIHILTVSYDGADAQVKNETTTKFFKYTKNNKVVYKGYSFWDYDVSGYSNNARVQWKITFNDWNPQTGAGVYEWWLGVPENSGGDTFPLYRYLYMSATESTNNMLHVITKWYDDHGTKVWEWEYDTTYEPVDMPETPDL